MVRVTGEDGEEHVYEAPLSTEVQEHIHKAGSGMQSAITSAKETFLAMNVDPEVVGKEASKILIDLREIVVFRLMIFKDYLLPLSKITVREVKDTLKCYFQDTSFSEFKTLLETLKDELEPCKSNAARTKRKFMLLAADLEDLKIQGDRELSAVIPKLEETLGLTNKKLSKSRKSAKRTGSIGTAVSFGSLVGSVAVAKGLLTTGGLIAAFPPLAPLVVTAGVAFAATARSHASTSASVHRVQENKIMNVRDQLNDTLETVGDINTQGIAKFQECLQGCADFFAHIENELESLSSRRGGRGGDEVLKIFHRQMKNQAGKVIKACTEYELCANKVETDIQVLDKFKPEKYRNQVQEWIKVADESL
ncbi:hypothetical protein KC19_9G039300 [Ceratodon purpureus]|uniref:Uncharacterized protein n=1 Tax=Ceratodon purpureus TaxID=3225 RepID=A0A8T0GSJ5_CERPU|nr:hypothetical protein KC19_9G039300 [Ceratodon purpureus]KAG0561124.1 hypothetical protein KC19_9G039300 [Ceratodon purpureus]